MYPMVSLNACRLYSAVIIDNGRLPINNSIALQHAHDFSALYNILELFPKRLGNALEHLRSAYYVFALFALLRNLLHHGWVNLLGF